MRASRPIDISVFAEARSRGLSPLLARIIAGRIDGDTPLDLVLDPKIGDIPAPNLLADLVPAVDRIVDAIRSGQPIGVLTDYDADGLTSHAVLTHALIRFGVPVTQISHWIGHRIEDGYGISERLVDRILEAINPPVLVISADCGSSDELQISRLDSEGIDVIVTDHHRISDAGPPVSAYAVINPNREDCDYPDKSIAGCMVSWLVMSAVRSQLIEEKLLSESTPKLGDLLDYVALGTIADCVSMGNSATNRIVVLTGLKQIQAKTRPCWQVAVDKLTKLPSDVDSEWLAFQLAPRLNARGRIDHSMRGFEFLFAENLTSAAEAYSDLDQDNQKRRVIEKQMVEHAKPLARRQRMHGGLVLCVVLENGHSGVQGIVASRLVETEGVPSIVLTPGTVDGTLTGSMRSVPGVDAKGLLDHVADSVPSVFIRYGGHAGACGMTLDRAGLESFGESLQAIFQMIYPDYPVAVRHQTDGELLSDDFELDRVEQISQLGPFGRGFESPLFEGVFEVISSQIIGRDGSHLSLDLRVEAKQIRAVWFGAQATGHPPVVMAGDWIDCVFSLSVNTYQGTELSVIIRHGQLITKELLHA
jgi:single-stranded-DNA-specific exonuclease|tara:strand:+ start:12480 stop:14246 length:1767 start_codon:yes stop_codon:yes gene_type:complete